jgi:hypothetical protein
MLVASTVTHRAELHAKSGADLVDLRSAIRYRLTAPVMFSWKGPGARRLRAKGLTRDISVAGVFVLASSCPPPDIMVMMEILFPSFWIGHHPLKLVTEGRVIRVEHPAVNGPDDGFAVFTEGLAVPEGGTF